MTSRVQGANCCHLFNSNEVEKEFQLKFYSNSNNEYEHNLLTASRIGW